MEAYWVFLIMITIVGYFIAHLKRTPMGKASILISGKDFAAELFGINPLKYKMPAFALYGFYASVGGAMGAYRLRMATLINIILYLRVSGLFLWIDKCLVNHFWLR